MYKPTTQLDLDVLDAVREAAQQSRQAMRREAGKVARGPTAQRIIVTLSREPGKRSGKVNWTNDRQRRAVMAKLRRSGNLPYQRSHRLAQGWRVVLESLQGDNGGVISVENSTPYADYVQGERQQRYLKDWLLARYAVRQEEANLQDELIDAWARAIGVYK